MGKESDKSLCKNYFIPLKDKAFECFANIFFLSSYLTYYHNFFDLLLINLLWFFFL